MDMFQDTDDCIVSQSAQKWIETICYSPHAAPCQGLNSQCTQENQEDLVDWVV